MIKTVAIINREKENLNNLCSKKLEKKCLKRVEKALFDLELEWSGFNEKLRKFDEIHQLPLTAQEELERWNISLEVNGEKTSYIKSKKTGISTGACISVNLIKELINSGAQLILENSVVWL